MTKLCPKCGLELSLECFNKFPRGKFKKQSYCKKCMLLVGNKWRNDNIDEYRHKRREASKDPKRRLKALLNANRCDRSKLSFDVLWKRLESNGFRCEITGIPFEYSPTNPNTMSIDKIDPSGEYTNENIRLICWWLNLAIHKWGLDAFRDRIRETRSLWF